ncbi:IclR family transcriptional regulator [Subtercola boreus]|nr:IclR family transcriptional regulator [Subtercola boreus]TQL55552.1 IclR family transcriptional regulator [Subtercola boreus]
MGDHLQSVSQALRMLRLLEESAPIGVSTLATELSIAPSTAHRLLSTLVEEGFAEQLTTSRKYALAPGITLTSHSSALSRYIVLAEAPMRGLRDASGETVHLAVRLGSNIRYVAAVESDQMMRVTSRVGREQPAHATAVGKVLLASLPDEEIRRMYTSEQLNRLSDFTLRSMDELLDEIATVRETGYARNVSESEIGMYAMAVAVHDRSGNAVCALAVAGPGARISAGSGRDLSEREQQILLSLRFHVAEVDRAMPLGRPRE